MTRNLPQDYESVNVLPYGDDVIVYAVVDDALSRDFPLGDAIETFIRPQDAKRFIEEVRRDDPELAKALRIEERELKLAG